MLRIDVVTLFPEVFAPFVGLSIVGRAMERGAVDVRFHNLLDALEKKERADGPPYGGGPGMVLRLEPLVRLLDRIVASAAPEARRTFVLTTPAGKPLDQQLAKDLSEVEQLIIVCGHYEGVDERLTELYPMREVSLGDFVLTGGEIPALAVLDAVVRLAPGAINPDSLESESFQGATLDFPSYTRPATFRGIDVPEVLLSGDHRRIAEWRRDASRERTAKRRPDL